MPTVTRERLQSISDFVQALEFDTPFTLSRDGQVWQLENAPYHGSVYDDPEGDVTVEVPNWHPMTGLTGQHGYRGACLHASEQMSPGIALAMLDLIAHKAPHTGFLSFVLTPVYGEDGTDAESWTVLYHHAA